MLCAAAECGNERALEALLVGRANVALADSKGRSAAHFAAMHGHASCLRLLLNAGAPKDARTIGGFTPLHLAAQQGRVECCSVLLAAGCALDVHSDGEGTTPLHYAAMFGQLAVIDLLLDAGAQIEAKALTGRTTLSVAASEGKLQAVRLMLARGADPNAVDWVGNTALMGVICDKCTPCFTALLPVSDLHIMSRVGQNSLHLCITTGYLDGFELLLPLVSDVDVRTVQGFDANGLSGHSFNETPLHLACAFGQHDMAKALLLRGASRTARDSQQLTPLHDASRSGHLSCVATLVGKPGAYKLTPVEVNAANVDGWTPLHFAVFYGHARICGTLLAAGARLDAVTSSGATPLILARQGHPANTALIDLLAGLGPAHPPGTVCDGCGRPETEVRLSACDGCLIARFCGRACLMAAWPAHKAECRRVKMAREERSLPNQVSPESCAPLSSSS